MIKIKVWGKFACFTNPIFKAERRSYPIMTPSAARGVLDSIYWKPEFRWIIKKISMLKPVKYQQLSRNEIKNKITDKGTLIGRTMRNTTALCDVEYIIEAEPYIITQSKLCEDLKKHHEIMERRLRKGQCHKQPYFGCREFTAYFKLSEEDEKLEDINMNLGKILYDIDYKIKQPIFFDATIKNGIMEIERPNNDTNVN